MNIAARSRDIIHGLRERLAKLRADERGVSAIEFALIAPVMLVLYFGALELSQAIGADRKVTLTARTVADLVSRVSTINNADMQNALAASSAVMAPYAVSNLKVTVSSITIDAKGNATVAWSDSLNGKARSVGSAVTLASALNDPGTSLIWGEVQYSYTPTIGYVIVGTKTLKDDIYMRPRLSVSVARTTN